MFLGPGLALALQLFGPPADLGREGWIVASLALWMATWWVTEAIPIPATALLPLVVFPLTGVLTTSQAAAPYASPIIILFLGGFMIALGLERWNLHTRIALNVVARAGGRPRLMILGFMAAAALLSMWISNTATTLMLIPIALSVAHAEVGEGSEGSPFVLALLLGVAYAASIGGVATPVGSPTNIIAIGFLSDFADIDIGFPQWMAVGLPIAGLMVPASWWMLTRWIFPITRDTAHAGADEVRRALADLGALTRPEARLGIVFLAVAVAWMLRQPLINLTGLEHLAAINGSQADATIAIAGALALFLLPAGSRDEPDARLMDWESTARLPWGTLLLYGGGFSLAAGIRATGLADWLGETAGGLGGLPPIILVLLLVAGIIFLTELTSNVATVTAFLPVIIAIGAASGINPVLLAAPAAIAASFAFMLPVATAPNAIAFSTGEVSIPQMMRAGFRLNLAGVVIITAVSAIVTPLVFG